MNRAKWQILLGLFLLVLSVAFYFLHYLIFRDLHHIFIYLLGDIAFVFVEVLLVTLIIHGVLAEREKKARLRKLNMVIGVFFSEVGTQLLKMLCQWDPKGETLRASMSAKGQRPSERLITIRQCLDEHDYAIELADVDWQALAALLVGKRDFLVRLLENPNLLEHETFTDLLWAVFHLTEELDARQALDALPDSDRQHLAGDVKRVYGRLAWQWGAYMAHLGTRYPYLFSLAVRTNPFDPTTSPVISTS